MAGAESWLSPLFIDPTICRTAGELEEVINKGVDYPVTIVQTSQGLLNAAWEARLDEDGNIITGLQVTQGIRMIGRRNMNLTAFGTALAGRAYWLDTEIADNTVMGYQTTDGFVHWAADPDTLTGFCLFPRDRFAKAAASNPDLERVLRDSNVCDCGAMHEQFAAEIGRRFAGQPSEIEDLAAFAMDMLLQGEPHPEFTPSPAIERVNACLINAVRRIVSGADISVQEAADCAGVHIDTFAEGCNVLTGMTPKALFRTLKAQELLELHRSDLVCAKRGIPPTLEAMAESLSISAPTARRLLRDLTGKTSTELRQYFRQWADSSTI